MAPQREWFEKDYYKVLGVSRHATEKDITSAYRKLAKQYHPDANPGSEERFKEISAAYDVLGDADKRKEYDEVRRLGPTEQRLRRAAAAARAGRFQRQLLESTTWATCSAASSDAPRRRRGSRSAATRPGPAGATTSRPQLHLSFQDAVNGVTTTVNVTSDVACHTCGGTGAAPGTCPVICSMCGGPGRGQRQPGLVLLQPAVPRRAAAPGMRVETPCPTCPGRGVERRGRQVKVRIPAGVEDGQRIRVKGRGGAGRQRRPVGRPLRRRAHQPPTRSSAARATTSPSRCPITFPEAALGATITVPTLDEPVTLKVPPGTRSGRTFRVRGRVCPARTGAGDLLVTVEVAVPEHLTDAEREADRGAGFGQRLQRRLASSPPGGVRPMPDRRVRPTRAVYVISVAAELAGVHPQTLRIYERKGLVDPARTGGGSRRYSERDIERLRRIQDLTNARPQPGGRPPGHRARGRGGPVCAASWPGPGGGGRGGGPHPPPVPPRPGPGQELARPWRRPAGSRPEPATPARPDAPGAQPSLDAVRWRLPRTRIPDHSGRRCARGALDQAPMAATLRRGRSASRLRPTADHARRPVRSRCRRTPRRSGIASRRCGSSAAGSSRQGARLCRRDPSRPGRAWPAPVHSASSRRWPPAGPSHSNQGMVPSVSARCAPSAGTFPSPSAVEVDTITLKFSEEDAAAWRSTPTAGR